MRGGDIMKKLAFLLGVAISIFATANIASAIQSFNDSISVPALKVGSQGSGGVTYFNGSIVNETTGTNDSDSPVTFGDNVRIDGKVYRGATAGTGDSMPFIVNDKLEVDGAATFDSGLTVTGDVTVNGNLTADAYLGELVSGTTESGSELTETEWEGTLYDVCDNELRETSITVTFTPTDESIGTWSSNPYSIFRTSMRCGDSEMFPEGTYSGSYKVIGDAMLAYDVEYPEGATATPTGGSMVAIIRGNSLSFIDYQNIPHVVVELTRSN